MSVYLYDPQTMDTVWELDLTVQEQRRIEAEWSAHPVEEQGDIAFSASLRPPEQTVEGYITAWPLDAVVTHDPERPADAWAKLEARWRARQPLQLVTTWWTETIGIKTADGSTGVEDGDRMRVSLTVVKLETIKAAYTTIPPSRLRKRVRKHSTPGKRGGAASTSTPSARAEGRKKSWAAWLVDKAWGR